MRSQLEVNNAQLLKNKRVPFEYEKNILKYTKPHRYTYDFLLPNGIIVETKGYFAPSDRTKHLRVREQNPNVDIRFVFEREGNFLNKKSSTTYAQWCNKNGYKWARGLIPEDWLKEDFCQLRYNAAKGITNDV